MRSNLKKFKPMREMSEDERILVEAEERPRYSRNVIMYSVGQNKDMFRFNSPVGNEVAELFASNIS